MNRPTITKEMILEAAKIVSAMIGDADAETIAKYYSHPMDGYQLAKELDRNAYWDLTMSDVEVLDHMSGIVSDIYRYAERAWAEANPIYSPLPIGTVIKEGVIEGIYEHQPGYYRVKEHGCKYDKRWLLIKFEDAIAVVEAGSEK